MLLDRSCWLAKIMGLHQPQTAGQDKSSDEEQRRCVFWLLFTLDKDLSFLVGAPPSLPLFDCDVPMPATVSTDQHHRLRACIVQERIYALLYSATGRKKSQHEREQAVVELEADLDRFERLQSEADPEDPISGWRGKLFLRLEIQYIYHQLRVAVLRCSRDPAKRVRCLEEARLGISNVAKIRVAKATVGGHMVLRR